jgi:hypothetical protein
VLRVLAWVSVIAAALGGACGGDDQGEFTLEFDTTFEVDDTLRRTDIFFNRVGYEIRLSGARERDAEKSRPLVSGGGEQIDILMVRAERGSLHTRVRIEAFTDLDDEHGRRRAAQFSEEVRRDAETLRRELLGANAGLAPAWQGRAGRAGCCAQGVRRGRASG